MSCVPPIDAAYVARMEDVLDHAPVVAASERR